MAESTESSTGAPLWKAVWNPRMLICVFIGFSSGLPLWFLWQLIPYWLRTEGMGLAAIGSLQVLLFPYNWKVVVAPFLDRYNMLGLGRRRGWMLASQIALLVLIAAMGFFNPERSMWGVAALYLAVAFMSSVQDGAIDAFRREILPDNELGLGSAIHINTYRVAGLVSFSLGVYLSKFFDWPTVHVVIALFMLPGALCSFWVKEPQIYSPPPKTMREAVIEPFKEFFQRKGIRMGVYVLAFMLLYKFGDNLATSLITPFYFDMGFSEEQIAFVTKSVALAASVSGGFLGGFVMFRIGINRALWIFGVVQFLSIFGLAFLATAGNDVWVLVGAVAFEYLGVGLGAAAFVAYQSKQADRRFTAMQLALYTSLMSIPRNLTGGMAGFLIEGAEWSSFGGIGYPRFFLLCAMTAIPGMLLLFKVAPWNEVEKPRKSVERSS